MLAANTGPLISTNTIELPRIGITMGDAAGIGPEIILKSLSSLQLRSVIDPVLIADSRHMRRTAERLGLLFDPVEPGTKGIGDKIPVYDLQNLPDDAEPGLETAATGRASGEYIERAVELWKAGEIDAIATAPISKKALTAGGYDFPGHTEFLAELTETDEFAMSFFAEQLRVVLLSTHISLSDAIKKVTTTNLIKLIEFANAQFARLLKKNVRLAVAGLNPHASEEGMFGTEEAEAISPAIEHCRGNGIDVLGPYSPDTIFLRGFRGEFDAVVACYHDQATIAVKSLSFGSSVNVTLGLPLIRTSVDHGTALDIASKGIADPSSMRAAIKLAGDLAALHQGAATV